MNNSLEFSVDQDKSKLRLDVYLVEQFEDKSRSEIQKNIKLGGVRVNDEIVTTPHHFLNLDDNIKWQDKQGKKAAERLSQDIERSVELFEHIQVIEQTENYLIINKPAGLLVHGIEDRPNLPSLVDWLIDKFPQTKQLGPDPLRPAIVHRLDKDVSGLMLIPLNLDAYDYYKKKFKLREVHKEYTALVHGKLDRKEGTVDLPISRSESSRKMAAHSHNQGGKKAITHYELIDAYTNHSLIKLIIETGRTHQIRVHMLALGHSIVGDSLYRNKDLKKHDKIERIFLHASAIAFEDMHSQMINYKSPLPEELQSFLKQLR